MNTDMRVIMRSDTVPWYKQPLVWMLIAIPASAVIAGIHMIYLAVTTADGLVVDEYYKHGLLINDQIERDRYAWDKQLAAEVDIDPDSGVVKVFLNRGELTTSPGSIELALRHATQQRQDSSLTLYEVDEGIYQGLINGELRRGVWYVEISAGDADAQMAWRLSRRTRIDAATTLTLLPLSPDTGR